MNKKGFQNDHVVNETTNGYVILGFTFHQFDPNNLNTARLSVIYSLASIARDGTATVSRIPGQAGCSLELQNVGGDDALVRWLQESGQPNDLMDFNYHDVERLVEQEIGRRFGIVMQSKKN